MLLEIESGRGEHGVFQYYFPSLFDKENERDLLHWKKNYFIDFSSGPLIEMPDPLDLFRKRPLPISNQLRSLIKGIAFIKMMQVSQWSFPKRCLRNQTTT